MKIPFEKLFTVKQGKAVPVTDLVIGGRTLRAYEADVDYSDLRLEQYKKRMLDATQVDGVWVVNGVYDR